MYFTMEERLVRMLTKPTTGSGQTTTTNSESEFIDGSTVSDSEKSAFTASDSVSKEELTGQPFTMTFTGAWTQDFSVSFAARIVECLEDGTFLVALENASLNDGSTGRCQKEAEQSGSSEEKPKLEEPER